MDGRCTNSPDGICRNKGPCPHRHYPNHYPINNAIIVSKIEQYEIVTRRLSGFPFDIMQATSSSNNYVRILDYVNSKGYHVSSVCAMDNLLITHLYKKTT